MNAFEKITNDLKQQTTATINTLWAQNFSTFDNFRGYVKELNAAVVQYNIDGKTPDIEAIKNKYGFGEGFDPGGKSRPGPSATTSQAKENVEPLEGPSQSPPRVRPKRRTRKQTTQNTANIDIKAEKMSIGSSENESGVTSAPFEPVTIKTEADLMPAPKKPTTRKKKGQRSNSVVAKQEVKEEMKRKDSEVVLQEPIISVITLSDSDDETVGRITRTKTRNTKRSRTDTESVERKEKRSRSDPKNNATITKDTTSNTENDDAVSTVEEGNSNATYIAKPSTKNNTTFTLGAAAQPEMTDDESDEEDVPPQQTLSAFEHSPVKKKIEAYEKLNCASSEIPRLTRTKKRELLKKAESANSVVENNETKAVKERRKMFTPGTSQSFRPKVCSTISKAPNDTTATLSALKASQAEYRERELKRTQKENEALMKREALMQAQIEEKKRKREEKQLKAQQMRVAMEKEKQMMKDKEQRQKEERHKQVLAEQERNRLKIREEAEKRRFLAKVKAIEEKKKEEERKREEDRIIEEMKKREEREREQDRILEEQRMERVLRKGKTQMLGGVPEYMRSEAPPLLPDDCYDSDDENYRKGQKVSWAKGKSNRQAQFNQIYVGETIKNTYFSRQATTPDLEPIFPVIEKSKLRRKSSACWKNPPRFTMIPGLEKYLEVEDDSSDSDPQEVF